MFVILRNMLLIPVCMLVAMGQAGAVGLGKIEVTSHLGEVFFAEAPLQLDAGEKLSDLSVELATASDYQILEVFRDAALNQLTIEIKNDERGTRAVIASTKAMDTPYFNLVLKIRHGHATNFKKYPVFLDLPEQVRPAESTVPVAESDTMGLAEPMQADQSEPSVAAVTPLVKPELTPAESEKADPAAFKPYENWARTSRYGPMVYGDTVSTVADRLAVDKRYSRSQIMVGLFNKNKDKFRENNVNLINAGTYLDVPTANEIAAVDRAEANRIIRDHEKQWKALKAKPVYAAEAEAQENRYINRVRVGKTASGAAAAPVQAEQSKAAPSQPEKALQEKRPQQGEAAEKGSSSTEVVSAQLRALQEENLELKKALQDSEARMAAAPPETADAASAGEQVKKLELTVARLQKQLTEVNNQLQDVRSQDLNALTYALGGIVILLIAFAGYLLFLLRRDRPHPSVESSSAAEIAPATGAMLDSGLETEGEALTPDTEAGEEVDREAIIASLDDELQEDSASDVSLDEELQETKKAEPQEGIDYLAEADVYLRYGMEDEALQQMNMAVEQRPDHLETRCKLVQLLQSRDDQEATDAAIESARSALSSDDLQAFEDSLVLAQGDGADSIDAGIDTAMDDAGETISFEDDALSADAESGLDLDNLDDQSEAVVDTDVDAEAVEQADDSDVNASEEEETAPVAEESDGLDFTIDDPDTSDAVESEQSDSATADSEQAYDGEGLSFDSPVEHEESADEDISEADKGLELDADTDIDFESAASDVTSLQDAEDDTIPETVIDMQSGDDKIDLDEILGDIDASEDTSNEIESGSKDEEDVVAAGGDLELGGILNEFDGQDGSSGDAGEESSDIADIADMPEMDISGELDELLAEWGDDKEDTALDAGPENLDVDRARSLLAEDSLDEAEEALQSALEGDRRGDALIGLAEVAAKRGDESRKAELLAEAEALVDPSNQGWFDSVKNTPS